MNAVTKLCKHHTDFSMRVIAPWLYFFGIYCRMGGTRDVLTRPELDNECGILVGSRYKSICRRTNIHHLPQTAFKQQITGILPISVTFMQFCFQLHLDSRFRSAETFPP